MRGLAIVGLTWAALVSGFVAGSMAERQWAREDVAAAPLVAVMQEGEEVALREGGEEGWLREAYGLARRRGEAVAVCQGGQLVCVVNPE